MSHMSALLQHPSLWLQRTGPQADVALASRVRLSRNLTRTAFPTTATDNDRQHVLTRVEEASGDLEMASQGWRIDLDAVSPTERRLLAERQLVPLAVLQDAPDRRLQVAADESRSFLVNGEDHLQFQAQCSGLDLQSAFEACDALDVEMDSRLDFAYSETYGFLTARPSQSGTGMRASVLLHLPGLLLRETFDETVAALRRQKILVEGFWMDGVRVDAHLFQVSNAATLGKREGEIVRSVDEAVRGLLQQELDARQELLSGAQSLLADRIWRSFGILSNARLLKARETLHHTSRLLLGVQLGLLSIPMNVLVELLSLSQEAHAQLRMQRSSSQDTSSQDAAAVADGEDDTTSGRVADRETHDHEIDAWRAERVRNELQGLNS